MDRYRRRSPERVRYPRDGPPGDSYVPGGARGGRPRSRSPMGGYRRRSRSPARADTWTPRNRSPPRRYDARDAYPSSRREYGTQDRYDRRRASPPPNAKRAREFSPNGRGGGRTPPPAKRERLGSPGRGFDRPRSPQRRGYSPPRDNRSYHPRSRSPPPRHAEDSYHSNAMSWRPRSRSPPSGRNSGRQSRRSSPSGYPRRPIDRHNDDTQAEPYSRNGLTRRSSPPARARSPYRQDYDSRARPPPTQDFPPDKPDTEVYRPSPSAADTLDRQPPTGPSSSRYAPSPAGGGPVSMSAHSRPSSTSIPPSGPSSYSSRGDYGSGYRGRGGPPPRDYPPRGRGGWGAGAPSGGFGRGGGRGDPYPPRDPYGPPRDEHYSRGTPAPRFGRGGAHFGHGRGGAGPAFTGGNSTSRTVPQTVRFDVKAALSDLPKVKEGGERLPPLYDTTKSERLEEEAARLRKEIDQKDSKLRRQLRELDTLEREQEEAQLRSELAEERLKDLCADENEVSGAF